MYSDPTGYADEELGASRRFGLAMAQAIKTICMLAYLYIEKEIDHTKLALIETYDELVLVFDILMTPANELKANWKNWVDKIALVVGWESAVWPFIIAAGEMGIVAPWILPALGVAGLVAAGWGVGRYFNWW